MKAFLPSNRGDQRMADVTIKIRNNGPLLVQGSCLITDQDENVLSDSNKLVALCRCGLSASKPMCDGSHTDGFDGALNPPT